MDNFLGLKTNTIVSAFQLKYLNNPVSINTFQEIIEEFNSLDVSKRSKVKNSQNELLK